MRKKLYSAALPQPIQFFNDFCFAVPRIFVEQMPFAGEDQKGGWDSERKKGASERAASWLSCDASHLT